MDHATLIVLLALLQYVWFTARVGLARGKYNVNAPACDGDETWNRLFRVQQNTMEQLIVFIPATFAFSYYMSESWMLVPGVAFLIGRFLYSAEYQKDPKTRTPGMAITLLSNVVLVLGALFGLIKVMFFS
jgi:glutathione S-transferase